MAAIQGPLSRIDRGMEAIEAITTAIGKAGGYAAVLGSVGLLFYEVIARYLFTSPTKFTLEVGLALQIVTVAAAAAYVLKMGGHVGIELVTERLPPRARAWAGCAQAAFGVAFCALIFWQVWLSASWSAKINKLTLDLEQPLAPIQFLMCGGIALLALQFVVQFCRSWRAARGAGA